MRIAFASSEVFPFAKVGGLGDVSGALPKALTALGHDVKVFLPRYSAINEFGHHIEYVHQVGEMPVRVSGNTHLTHVFKTYLPDSHVEVYLIDCPHYYHRKDYKNSHLIYTNHGDEDERFIHFSKAVIETIQRLKWAPEVLHVNDWPTAIIPLLLRDNYSWDRFFDNTATAITIHNIGYQGRFSKDTIYKAEIRPELFYQNSPIEVWGSFCFLKSGLMYSDVINTVSMTYAREITTSDYGEGLQGVLNYRINDFFGIINGVDYSVWNPDHDPMIPYRYSPGELAGKLENKKYLLRYFHMPFHHGTPVIGMVSRLVGQKGFDIIADAVPELLQLPAQYIILGSGEQKYEDLFEYLHQNFPDKVGIWRGKNEELAHLIEAGSDMFLMPSLYEPCGLNQIYSLKYGTVPLVRRTGGLADTVMDWHEHFGVQDGTGFSFYDYNAGALISTVRRAIETFHHKDAWHKLMMNGMAKDYSWEVSAKRYEQMYHHAIAKRK